MTSIWSWSKTAADNDDADSSIVWLENQAPSTVNNSARQMMGRVAELLEDAAPLRASTGAANVYSVTINSAPGGWVNGMRFSFRAHQANTSSAIVSVNGYATKPLRRRSGVALAPGEIDSGAPLTCVYVQSTDEVLIVAGQAPSLGTSADVYARLVRTGTVMAWTSSTVPAGWLECNGAAISRSTYAELFGAIGTTYGVGDGSTTFNIPDYRGQFLRGWANGQSTDPDRASRTNRGDGTTGDAVGTKQAGATASHTHSATLSASVNGTLNTTATASGSTLTVSTSGTLSTTATLSGGTALAVSVSGTRTGSTSGALSVSVTGVTDVQGAHSHTYQVPFASAVYGAGGSGTVWVASTTSASTSGDGAHGHNVSASGTATGSLSVSTSGTLTGTASGTVAGTATGTMTGTATGTLTGTATGTLTGTATGTTGASGGNETRPTNVNVMWIILALPAQASAGTLGLAGLAYTFASATTDADPGVGKLRFNNATLASVTAIYISETDGYGAPMAAVLQSYAVNTQFYIYKVGAPQNYLVVQTAGVATDAGVYDKFTSLTVIGSNGSFIDGDPVAVVPFRSAMSFSYFDLPEISDPTAPSADTTRLYAKDVSGTTQLYMRTGSGTIVPITGKAALEAIFASLSNASAFNSGDKLIAYVGGLAQVIDYNDLPSAGGAPPSVLGSDEGVAFDFLARTAIINDFSDALSDSGRPHSLLTETRATTATYVGRDRLLATAANDTLRYDHNPATGAPKGVLIEPSATNLLTYSAEIDNASWTKSGSTITANSAVAPDGTTTADSLIEDGTAGVSHRVTKGGITVTNGQPYIFSVWAKANTRSVLNLVISDGTASWARKFDVSAGTSDVEDVASVSAATVYGMEQWANGWWRCWVGVTMTATTSSCQIRLNNAGDTYAGDGTSGLFVWGAQFELTSALYPSSYIATGAATATRNADAVSIQTSAIPGNPSSQGTLFVDATAIGLVSASVLELNNNSTTERVALIINSGGSPAAFIVDNNVTQANLAIGAAVVAGTSFKIGTSYALNDIAASRDGSSPSTDTSATMPTITQMQIGRRSDGATLFNGHVRRVAWFSRRLTSAELQTLTT